MTSHEEIREPTTHIDEPESRVTFKWGLLLLVILVAVGALVAVFLGAPVLHSKGVRFLRYREQAAAFRASGEFSKAISKYKEALELKPEDLEVRKSIAECRLRSGDLPEAIAEYYRCLGNGPNDTQMELTLASLYLLAKNIDHAGEIVDATLRQDPDDDRALIMEAQCHYERGATPHPIVKVSMVTDILPTTVSRYDRDTPVESLMANPDYEKELLEAVKASPDKVQPYKNLADFYRIQKRFEGAEEQYRKMVEIAPRDPDVRLHLADFYRRQEVAQLHKAIREYSEILETISSKNLFALRGIAGLSLATGDRDSAKTYIDRLLWEQSSDIFGRYFRGVLEIYDSDITRAESDLRFASEENPTYAPAHFLLGYTRLVNHDITGARKSLEQASRVGLAFAPSRLLLAEIALNLDEYEKALEIIDRLLTDDRQKDNALAYLMRGRIFISQNDYAQAEAPFAKLAQLDQQGVYPKLLLGGVYKRIAKSKEAAEQYELAVAADAKSPIAPYLLGLLYEKTGEPALSIRSFEEAVKRDANFAAAARSLADAYVRSEGENADAKALAQSLLERFPNDFALVDVLSTVFYERREFEKAIAVLELIPSQERDARLEIVYHYASALRAGATKAQDEARAASGSKAREAEERAARWNSDARRELRKAQRLKRRLPKTGDTQETLDEIVREQGITG